MRTVPEIRADRTGHSATIRSLAPGALLSLGAWLGIATGLLEVVLRLVEKRETGLLFFGPQLVWMAPLADALIFTAAATCLLVLDRFRPGAAALRPALCLFLTLSLTSVLFLNDELHRLAAVVLALGVALQLSRWIAGRRLRFKARLGRGALWGAAFLLALFLTVQGGELVHERRSLARLPPAARSAPNVLLLVLDTVRARSMSLYGYGRLTTPELARFAREGVRFERAFATTSWTPSSHHSLMTGRFPHQLPLDAAQAPVEPVFTLAEALASHGYATAGFVANMKYTGYEQELDRGFAHYEDYPVSLGELALSSTLIQTIANHQRVRRLTGVDELLGRKTATDLHERLLRWLGAHPDRPFFVFINYYDAHRPYLPPPPFDTMFGPAGPRVPLRHWNQQADWQRLWLSPTELEAERSAYDGAIAFIDQELGRLFGKLRARGILENTLVIVTADHGELFGEHNLYGHGHSLYRTLLHVPLVVVFPRGGVPARLSVPDPVSLRDVPATVIDLTGLTTVRDRFAGASLASHWRPPRLDQGKLSAVLSDYAERTDALSTCVQIAARNFAPNGELNRDQRASLVALGYHYIRSGDGREQLYDFERDPDEAMDLVTKTAEHDITLRLRATVRGLICSPSERGLARATAEDFLFADPPDLWAGEDGPTLPPFDVYDAVGLSLLRSR